MIRQLRRGLSARCLVVVADISYAVVDLLACSAGLRQPVMVITRLPLDAALYDPAPVRQPGTKGRPRKKGERQPTLAKLVTDPQTQWKLLSVSWYGKQQRMIEGATETAVWFHNGLPAVAIRWVLVRDPEGKFCPQALLCTDQQADARAILEWFVLRWPMEVTFHEVRTHLGVETQRQWADLAILHTTPARLGPLFSGDDLCSSVTSGSVFACSSDCLVYQSASHFFGYAGFGSSTSLASGTFFPVACQTRHGRNSQGLVRAPY
jgi:hypothetical protein